MWFTPLAILMPSHSDNDIRHMLLFSHLLVLWPLLVLGQLVSKSAQLMIERLRVRIPAEVVGEFSSPELTFCADSYSVSVPPVCYRSGM